MFRGSRKEMADQIKQEFLPRPDKYHDMINNKQVPTTHESLVVIPCLTKTYGFKTNQYKLNEKYLRGVISEQQFNGFVRRANRVIERELINKSGLQNEPFFKLISILLKVSIIISTFALFVMAVVVYGPIGGDAGDIAFESAGALLCISGLIACLCPIVLFRSSYSSLNYEKIISEKLKEIEAEENKINLAKRVYHITWKIQKNFYWIELHINRVLLENNLPTDLP